MKRILLVVFLLFCIRKIVSDDEQNIYGEKKLKFKRTFISIQQNLLENTRAGGFFLVKLQDTSLQFFLKIKHQYQYFSLNFMEVFKSVFLNNTSDRIIPLKSLK